MRGSWKRFLLVTGAVIVAAALPLVAMAAGPWANSTTGSGWGGMGGYGGGMGGYGGGMMGSFAAGTDGAIGNGGWGMMGGGWGMMGGSGGEWNNMLQWHGIGQAVHQRELEAAAGALSIATDDLVKQLYAGKSLADLAQAGGVTLEELTATVATARNGYFDELAQSGAIPAEQLQWMQQNMNYMGLGSLYGGAMMASGACH